MAKAVVTKETFDIPCKVYGCNKRSVYRLGNPTGHPAVFYHLCEEHARDIFESFQEELVVVPEEVVEAEKEQDIEKSEVEDSPEELIADLSKEEVEAPKEVKAATTTKKTTKKKVTK